MKLQEFHDGDRAKYFPRLVDKYVIKRWFSCLKLLVKAGNGKLSPRLTGLPYLADQATRLGGSPHLSYKRDQDNIRNHMNRRVTPPRRVTSPTWGPPPPCKQALILVVSSL